MIPAETSPAFFIKVRLDLSEVAIVNAFSVTSTLLS